MPSCPTFGNQSPACSRLPIILPTTHCPLTPGTVGWLTGNGGKVILVAVIGWTRKAQSPRRFALFLLLMVVLSGCQGIPGQATLPTRVEAASVPSATPTLMPGVLPPTWTPEAVVERGTELFRQAGPTLTPSVTATVPPRTPIPTITATPTITPTDTPFPNIATIIAGLPPSTELGPSKLGVHVVQNNDPAIMEFVRQSQPAVMKGVGDLGFLAEVRAQSPRTIIVGRIDDIFIQNYIGNPEEAAREYVNKHLNTYRANPAIDYWEGWNEPDPGPGLMSWYARFEQERIKAMAEHGLKSAIGGFPPGVPEIDEFAMFLPAVETGIQYGAIMTLHEGDISEGNLLFLYGSPLPGYPAYPDRGLMSLRYRWFYREILEPANMVIPLVVSELEFAGWDSTSEAELIGQLAWYDTEVRKDGYFIGFTVFTAGAINQWIEFNVNQILPELTTYVQSQR